MNSIITRAGSIWHRLILPVVVLFPIAGTGAVMFTTENAFASVSTHRCEGEGLRITTAAGSKVVAPGIYPTTHWNPGVLGASRVLNTISGKVTEVDLIPMGEEQVMVEGRSVTARRFRYTGEIQPDVWYDADGRWVKMRFNAKDGSTIESVCERCGGAAGGA